MPALEISWDTARFAMRRLIPSLQDTWDSYQIGEAAEAMGIAVVWNQIPGPLNKLEPAQILAAILSAAPRPLTGMLTLLTQTSFVGGNPYELPAEDLAASIREGPAHALDGGLIIIAPASGHLVLYQSEDAYALFAHVVVPQRKQR